MTSTSRSVSMPALTALMALAVASSGCFTTWATFRAAGYPGAVEESVREERVPLPGITEKLVVSLAPEGITATTVTFDCKANQHAIDAVYRSAYRYGSRWRKTYSVMFALEALAGGVLLLAATKPDDPDRLSKLAGGAFFAVDALGTGVLALFAPRKELFDRRDVPVTTPVRDVCPAGLMVEIGVDSFPLDAAGRLGDLGTAALDEWMKQPTGSLVVTFAGRGMPIDVREPDLCRYEMARGRDPSAGPGSAPPTAVPVGSPYPIGAEVAPGVVQQSSPGPAAFPAGPRCAGMPRILSAVIDLPPGTLALL